MSRSFLELEVGDYIWYYDHYKLHKQLIKSIEHKVEENKWTDYMGRECTISHQYIIIKAGRGSVLKIWNAPHINNRDTIRINGMVRFSSYEAALNYISYLRTKHIQKANKLQKRLDRELNIIDKYEF